MLISLSGGGGGESVLEGPLRLVEGDDLFSGDFLPDCYFDNTFGQSFLHVVCFC